MHDSALISAFVTALAEFDDQREFVYINGIMKDVIGHVIGHVNSVYAFALHH